jgi:hypothetical protein
MTLGLGSRPVNARSTVASLMPRASASARRPSTKVEKSGRGSVDCATEFTELTATELTEQTEKTEPISTAVQTTRNTKGASSLVYEAGSAIARRSAHL